MKFMNVNFNIFTALLRFPGTKHTSGFPALSTFGDEYSLYRAAFHPL